MEKLYDITAVCKELGTTSRTLRHWEEKGIVESTKSPFSNRRQYSEAQIESIKKVIFLRSIGIPITDIQKWQMSGEDIKVFIEERRSRLLSFIERKVQEYERLSDAYMSLCDGNDIFKVKESGVIPNAEQLRIAGECTVSIISGELAVCLSYFSQKMKDYMPLEVFRKVREDTMKPLGEFSGNYTLEADRKNANVVFARLNYEKLGLYIKYVFSGNVLHGLWFNYYGDSQTQLQEEL